jgi:phospholipase C
LSAPRDPEAEERLAFREPREYMRRREFLERTALAAGLAAGLGHVLDADTLVAEAARRQRRARLPSPRNMPVDTFVVLMMENRSFDHYLGWLPGADGRQAGVTYVDRAGQAHATRRLAPDWQGCGHPDPDHSWGGGRAQLNGGRMDGFLRSGSNDEFAISYYAEGDLGFIQDAAKAFTAYDRFHCSLLGPTFPNREYMHAAQSYGQKSNTIPAESRGFPDTTIFAACERAGVSCRYYFNDLPASGLWGEPALRRSARIEEYYMRCANGTLPHVSYVDPAFGAAIGEPLGVSGDEHPHGDVRTGQAFMADVVHAFMESPQWRRGALFIVYDEHGGFFDHVRPPRVPDDRNSRDLNEDFGQMGIRIPAVVVSPYAGRRFVSHSIYGFESILKLIEYRFGLRPLTRRDRYASNIGRSFDWESRPRLGLPRLPRPEDVVSQPCPQGASEADQRGHQHDLMALHTSGYLDRLGFEYRPASASSTFREPSKVTGALAETAG